MIRTFRHNGLRRLYETGESHRLPPETVLKIRRVLAAMDTAGNITELGLFLSWRLHRLKGALTGYWSITITGNWRIIFQFEDGDVFDVDYVDYH